VHELYTLVADPDSAQTMFLLFVIFWLAAYMSYVIGNVNREARRFTTFETVALWVCGGTIFLSLTLIFGDFFFEENMEALLELLKLDGILGKLSTKFQRIVVTIFLKLMR